MHRGSNPLCSPPPCLAALLKTRTLGEPFHCGLSTPRCLIVLSYITISRIYILSNHGNALSNLTIVIRHEHGAEEVLGTELEGEKAVAKGVACVVPFLPNTTVALLLTSAYSFVRLNSEIVVRLYRPNKMRRNTLVASFSPFVEEYTISSFSIYDSKYVLRYTTRNTFKVGYFKYSLYHACLTVLQRHPCLRSNIVKKQWQSLRRMQHQGRGSNHRLAI